MSGCHVCGADAAPESQTRGSARCGQHQAARDHVISMQTDKIVCRGCGWERWISHHNPGRRDAACIEHWENVCALEAAREAEQVLA